ncbi:Cof-type HAD-IIB family hydrolase [Paenibacillus ginsengarvi]|uniref:HAD family phosphatase n=1 Tax=Paenibacillus ginsengarvi TaxID=400777 RepID=A0A3B0BQ19_9BACL|nr:HAD family hydrolase [Paenibacillus ginsengarvi]RKN74127.1 HAD family phosphatase [Paenibacillus ginsengarvi]
MSYKLIALDMDGTLLRHGGIVSDENRKWIAEARRAGKHVILATGRPVRSVLPYAEELGLDSPLIINNGSEVWRTPSLLHSRHCLDSGLVARLFGAIRPYGGQLRYWAHTVSGKVDNESLSLAPSSQLQESIDALEWLQFAIRPDNPDHLPEIRREVESWNSLEISNSHPSNMEFNRLGISKASGLREVCGLLGVDLSETIAAGDSLNDIPMIRAAGFGVAMGNAQEPVKLAADAVAPTNAEDGVADIIRRYLLS